MVGVIQRPLLPLKKRKAKAFSSTSSVDTLLGLKPGRHNCFQKDVLATDSKVYPKIVSKDWLVSNKPYPCAQTHCARSSSLRAALCLGFAVKRSFLTFGFGVRASLRTTFELAGERSARTRLVALQLGSPS